MQQNLVIGLFDVAPETSNTLRQLLEAQGCEVRTIEWFDSSDGLDAVFFYADESHVESFSNNQDSAVWVAVEVSFLEPRFNALLEFGVHDVLMAEDISERLVRQVLLRAFHRREVVRKMFTHDTQTGCLNAEGFAARVEQAIVTMSKTGRPFGLCSLDIAQFQKLNEEHGYAVANQILCMVAQRLALVIGGRFDVGRLGGDEFLLLAEDLSDKEEFAQALDIVRSSFGNSFNTMGKKLHIEAYIGAVVYPEIIGGAEELIAQAHEAMVTGKRYKQQVYLYDRAATPWFQMDMAAEIRRALREDEFQLHYQPRVELATNKVVGMEALIRWKHPKVGHIPPTDFIHAAESSGMILPLGNWILERAEQDVVELERQNIHGLNVAINLSFKQLQDQTFCESLPKRIKAWRPKHTHIEFELTETAVMNNPKLVRKTLQEISELGVKISLDDFGTGYSALVHVQEFPISTVKIDKSFVQRMEHDRSAKMIVESIVSFAHRLNLEVVGEGIESQCDLKALSDMGCEQGQGFYFSRALPLQQFIEFTQQTNNSAKQSSSL